MLKPRGWWLFWLPSGFWITLSPNIYFPKGTDVNSYPQVVAHESVHLRQQSEGNLLWWYLRYVFSWEFRLKMEVEAYKAQIKFCEVHLGKELADWTREKAARDLSSWKYLWAGTYNDVIYQLGV